MKNVRGGARQSRVAPRDITCTQASEGSSGT